MLTISELKEQAVTETPLLVFDCALADGRVERWSTHRVTVGDASYEPRVLRHNVFEIQAASEHGVDGVPRISLSLANADSYFSQLERAVGVKGAKLTARFLFYDLNACEPASEAAVVFLGTCNPPDEITEPAFRISATNRMNMQRVLLPAVRIQRRCPWNFPITAEQRSIAVDGGPEGKYSRYYRCGYSADVPGGSGLLDGGAPFGSCAYTREDCAARGMLRHFGGLEFVPSTIQVRSFGEKGAHDSSAVPNEARYNDFVPIMYGTAWYNPPVVFARNDGNLTRMEVLLGIDEIDSVVKVLVNEVEIPLGQAGANMTGTGWYNVPTLGARQGGFNLDFVNSDGTPAGDPYGSMAYLSLVVPNRINNGRSLPSVKVLVRGLKLPVYSADGAFEGERWSSNPAWILLDLLRRSGWCLDELNVASFASAAAYCDEEILARDWHDNETLVRRFQCNLVVQKRRSAGDVIRGVRNASRLYLTYGANGQVELRVENAVALQQPAKPAGSNSTEPLNGGWPAYEFGDGTGGRSGILRRANGEPFIRLWSRSSSDTANRVTVEFQDAWNEYQQDSFSLTDPEDVARAGQEITAPLGVLGIPNPDQAARILRYHLDKSVRGNTYVEFATSVKALGLRPGDLISLTYLKEGFDRQAFRVLKIAPGTNYSTAVITAQMHRDEWYLDTNGQGLPGKSGRETTAAIGLPGPLVGTEIDEHGDVQLGVEEKGVSGEGSVRLEVSFAPPRRPETSGPRAPLVSLAASLRADGTLAGGQSLYYAVSGLNPGGIEGPLSFLVRATIPAGASRSVTLEGLSFAPGTAAFHVYRGSTPAQLYRIASDVALSSEYKDTGLEKELTPAPDANFDHANFYWRAELVPETAASVHSATTIGNESLQVPDERYRGAVVRITRGPGVGQERRVVANSATTLTVSPKWDIEPEAGSHFTVAEAGWRFGALSSTSPVQFEVPYRPGEVVQVCGRAANVNDAEAALELSTVTRWVIEGDGAGDAAVPSAPSFGISPGVRGGTVEVRAIAFPDLANTRTVTSGTLTLFYWNELSGAATHSLAEGIGAADAVIALGAAGLAEPGGMLQIEAEIMRVEELLGPARYRVTRGVHDTSAAAHEAGTAVYHLEAKTLVLPFPKGFFGSPYNGSWSYPMVLPDVRLASAELFMTNRLGNGAVGSMNLTQVGDGGMRTLSGGQYTIQVNGFLAIDEAAAPALVVDATHAVRDVFAVLGRAADSEVDIRVNVNGVEYCTLTIPAGATTSNSVDGFGRPALASQSRVSVSVVSVGRAIPGSDLTVVIRL